LLANALYFVFEAAKIFSKCEQDSIFHGLRRQTDIKQSQSEESEDRR